jgi:hypothetical protein
VDNFTIADTSVSKPSSSSASEPWFTVSVPKPAPRF